MASMSKQERALYYLNIIHNSANLDDATKEILTSLNSLSFTSTGVPLSKREKNQIIEELEQLLFPPKTKRWTPSNETITEASDNSGILDVISALKRGAK